MYFYMCLRMFIHLYDTRNMFMCFYVVVIYLYVCFASDMQDFRVEDEDAKVEKVEV